MTERDVASFAAEMQRRFNQVSCGVLTFFEDGVTGKVFVDGLFRLHDQEGVSLADSLIVCHQMGIVPCVGQFHADALRSGWSREKTEKCIRHAISDAHSIVGLGVSPND